MIRIFLSFLLLFVLTTDLQSQTTSQTQTLDSTQLKAEKFRLLQKMLSCQSIAKSIMNETDEQKRTILLNLGYTYYNDAYQHFLKIQTVPKSIDDENKRQIAGTLEMYAECFRDPNFLRKPQIAVALSIADDILNAFAKVLICG